jgi:FtsH-binding integral membrane protein
MSTYSSSIIDVHPISNTGTGKVYFLLALALLCTGVGVFLGALFAPVIINGGFMMLLLIAELGLIMSAPLWMNRSPLNYILFVLFPVLSGISITPFILSVSYQYVNGTNILINASLATTLLCIASGVIASNTTKDLSASYGWMAFQALIGMLIFGLIQMFSPALRGGPIEIMFSGVGVVLFSLYTAIDLQKVMRRTGDSPFLMALTLYLDIFNLFLAVVRFMLATSGRRR